MSTFALLLLSTFILEAQPFPTLITLGPPPPSHFLTTFQNIIYYSLCIWVEERERDSMAEMGNTSRKTCLPGIVITLLLEGARRKTRSQHSHANTRQAHSTSIPGSLWAAPQLLPGLCGIPLQCSSLSSLCPIPPGSRGAGAVSGCRCGEGLAAAGCSLGCRALAPARAAAAAAAPDDAEEEESRVRRRRRMLAVMLLPWLPNSAAAPLRATAAPAPRSAGTHGCRAALDVQAQGRHLRAPLRGESGSPGGWRALTDTVFGALGKQMEWCIQNVCILHLSAKSSLPCKGQTPASRRERFSFLGGSCIFIKNWTKQQSWRREWLSKLLLWCNFRVFLF